MIDCSKIDISGYESPIELISKNIAQEIYQKQDEIITKAIFEQGVVVDKDELIKALRYDREQYEIGYRNGFYAARNEKKKPIKKTNFGNNVLDGRYCPCCDRMLCETSNYCPCCGQALDWSE